MDYWHQLLRYGQRALYLPILANNKEGTTLVNEVTPESFLSNFRGSYQKELLLLKSMIRKPQSLEMVWMIFSPMPMV